MKFVLAISLVFLVGCSDAERAKFGAWGDDGQITCYSGGKEIYNNRSSGKILSEERSDGWFFKEKSTGDLIRVSGDCLIRN